MSRVALSVRFPESLARALDDYAGERQWSRSDLVEKIITATTAADRGEVLKTPVPGAATEKLNLRLSAEALAHLKDIAGDLPPAEFLRRAVACTFPDAGDDVAPDEPASSGRGHDNVAPGCEGHVALIRLLVVALVVAVAALVWLLVLRYPDLPPGPQQPPDLLPPPKPEPRGQLPDGTAEPPGA